MVVLWGNLTEVGANAPGVARVKVPSPLKKNMVVFRLCHFYEIRRRSVGSEEPFRSFLALIFQPSKPLPTEVQSAGKVCCVRGIRMKVESAGWHDCAARRLAV